MIPCGKGIELDVGGRLQRGSVGCEDIVRQTDEHTFICSMVHILKKKVRYVCVCELCLRCQHRLFISILCPRPRHTAPTLGRWVALT